MSKSDEHYESIIESSIIKLEEIYKQVHRSQIQEGELQCQNLNCVRAELFGLQNYLRRSMYTKN